MEAPQSHHGRALPIRHCMACIIGPTFAINEVGSERIGRVVTTHRWIKRWGVLAPHPSHWMRQLGGSILRVMLAPKGNRKSFQRYLTCCVFLAVGACTASGGSTGPTMSGGGNDNAGGATGNNHGPQGGVCCFSITGCKSGTEIPGPSDCPAGVTCFQQPQPCGQCVPEVWCAPTGSPPDASSDASSEGPRDAN